MFEHRFRRFGRAFILAVCLLFVGGMQQSCRDWLDDYKYDDSEPEWLGASVYNFLQEGTPNHTYKNYVELIDSLGERETLERTGSKTLFIADDKAFERFYANNPWGVKSVKDMSVAQRRYILYNTMLDNATLLDMMPNSSENSEGDCVSRETAFESIDSIPFIDEDYYPLHKSWPTYNIYWDFYPGKKGNIRLALTTSERHNMVHFFKEYLEKNAVLDDDMKFVYSKSAGGKDYKTGDILLYDNKLVGSDLNAGSSSEDTLTITCKNGYLYRMDKVLLPPMDMASELRVREDTRIFSHLLDRFCVPVYNSDWTADYRERHGSKDEEVYTLRYLSDGYNGSALEELFERNGMSLPNKKELLRYDPGSNQGGSDLYSILVPKDEHLYEYFANPDSVGNFFVKNYAPDAEFEPVYSPKNVDKLLSVLDSIPQLTIATFLNNLMQSMFTSTVPSKFDRVTDDANDDMGLSKADVDECLIASNGVIYLLNKVFSPAQFLSVSGPVDIYENMRIMRQFIQDLGYNYYLLAMDAAYTLIVPDDNNFVYYDPVSYDHYGKVGYMKMYSFHYDANHEDNTDGLDELWHKVYEVGKENFESPKETGDDLGYNSSIARELLEYLIVVHDKAEPTVHKDRLYYRTKGKGTIKIDASGDTVKFYGGEQLEKGTEIVASMSINQKNGITYCTVPAEGGSENVMYSSIPTPPIKSVYQNMSEQAVNETDLYYEFYKLCSFNDELESTLKKIYPESYSDSLRQYSIFYTDNSLELKNSVPFFNTYHYTVYIPANESIKEQYELGLPTSELIKAEADKNPQKAMSMLRLLNNFLRYHFQDYSVYHDRSPFYVANVSGDVDYEVSFATSIMNPVTKRFYELTVKSDKTGKGVTPTTILVQDYWAKKKAEEAGDAEKAWDYAARVKNTNAEDENKTWNVMCRDRAGFDNIATSSFSVIQPIDRVLLNESLFGYDGRFARFATNGCRVDTMYVKGGAAGKAGFGNDCYLVADAGRVPRSTKARQQLKELENVELAYLMQPLAETDENYNSKISLETLVYDADKTPILITKDGYRVVRKEDAKKAVYYEYYTKKDDKGNEYIIKVDNAGDVIEEKLYKEKEVVTPDPEEGEEPEDGKDAEEKDENVEEEGSSNGETSEDE